MPCMLITETKFFYQNFKDYKIKKNNSYKLLTIFFMNVIPWTLPCILITLKNICYQNFEDYK